MSDIINLFDGSDVCYIDIEIIRVVVTGRQDGWIFRDVASDKMFDALVEDNEFITSVKNREVLLGGDMFLKAIVEKKEDSPWVVKRVLDIYYKL